MPSTPGAGATEFKSPKSPRRYKTPEICQVHFDSEDNVPSSYADRSTTYGSKPTGFTTANSPSGGFCTQNRGILKNGNSGEVDPTPTSFPQVGQAPTSHLQWHTGLDPSQSISHQLPRTWNYATLQQHQQPPPQNPQVLVTSPQFPPTAFPQPSAPVTYIGLHQQPPQANMGDYQNSAPPPTGVHFQPPVPDTTFGPIPHVYVPRHDGGLFPGVHVRYPSVQFVSAPVYPIAACTTVILPKTFYLNGYTSYATFYERFVTNSPSQNSIRHCANFHLQQQPALGVMPPQATQGSYVIAQQPYMIQQPVMGQQPVMVNNQPQLMPQFVPMAGMPAVGLPAGAAVNPGFPVIAGNTGHIPEVAGVGRTAGEETLHQIKFAIANGLYEPQDFKPSDDDPNRFYFVREVDGNWTQRNRYSIDNMGEIRWFVTNEGWFYAVRLPS
ncbi:hypothetical protein EDB81DRAFT_935355 [Dactylonectria macrodidyma]|uniref:Uncharacterized protein n=1 Tax=Dactylonectria macrodidyma TaxID=307937 RepID=A0A9P9ES23_9HYPO|nr:hypothetical protein EDB81DRAFT_935355 [Dactylonectria macrodidyma]